MEIASLRKARIADARILPFIAAANPILTVHAIAERATELITQGNSIGHPAWTTKEDADEIKQACLRSQAA
jgi:choline dehydrogenase-like flavoprotein